MTYDIEGWFGLPRIRIKEGAGGGSPHNGDQRVKKKEQTNKQTLDYKYRHERRSLVS